MSESIQHIDVDSDEFIDAPKALRDHVKKLQTQAKDLASHPYLPAILDENLRPIDAFRKAIPMRRFAQPSEVADAILFFASDRSRYITGQVLSVSGGLTMAG